MSTPPLNAVFRLQSGVQCVVVQGSTTRGGLVMVLCYMVLFFYFLFIYRVLTKYLSSLYQVPGSTNKNIVFIGMVGLQYMHHCRRSIILYRMYGLSLQAFPITANIICLCPSIPIYHLILLCTLTSTSCTLRTLLRVLITIFYLGG